MSVPNQALLDRDLLTQRDHIKACPSPAEGQEDGAGQESTGMVLVFAQVVIIPALSYSRRHSQVQGLTPMICDPEL